MKKLFPIVFAFLLIISCGSPKTVIKESEMPEGEDAMFSEVTRITEKKVLNDSGTAYITLPVVSAVSLGSEVNDRREAIASAYTASRQAFLNNLVVVLSNGVTEKTRVDDKEVTEKIRNVIFSNNVQSVGITNLLEGEERSVRLPNGYYQAKAQVYMTGPNFKALSKLITSNVRSRFEGEFSPQTADAVVEATQEILAEQIKE